jgi:alpha-glucosidase
MSDIPTTESTSPAADAWLRDAKVTTPPDDVVKRLGLDKGFYRKHVNAMGIPIVASEKVSEPAVLEAGYLTVAMLQNAPDIAARIAENKGRIAVMGFAERTRDIPEHAKLDPAAYDRCRGVGGTMSIPVSSCGEEDLLDYDQEPYWAENIFIHEFAHTIHLLGLGSSFNETLLRQYKDAMAAGLWQDAQGDGGKKIPAYAARDHHEYWAEGVQSYFGCNCDHADPSHNGTNGREKLEAYDPGLCRLVARTLGDNPWRYVPTKVRAGQPHLAGLDRPSLPKFSWG